MKFLSVCAATVTCLLALAANLASGATLEKLSLEEMSARSTLIVRGRIVDCAGETQGSLIFTRCRVAVSESWKGQAAGRIDFVVPGGRANGLIQTFTGTPRFASGDEHVLFLWAGRTGVHQVIGLSQGKFDLHTSGKGEATARRAAASERMLDATGREVVDEAVELRVSELRNRVRQALAAGARQ